MLFEYKKVKIEHFDCNILFFGRELTEPDYVYSGNNTRDDYVLHFILSGKGSFASAGNKMTQLEAGDVFILPRSVPCLYKADHENPWEYSWIGLSGSSLRDMLSRSQLMEKHYLKQTNQTQFAKDFSDLFHTLHNPLSLSNQMLVQSILFKTLYNLIQEFPSSKPLSKASSFEHFDQAVQLMNENLEAGFNVSDVAATLHLSRTYLHTIFKKYAECSPQSFLLSLRMSTAKEILNETSFSIREVASLVGYKDPFTFSKAFKRIVKKSPQDYRQQN